MLRRACPNAQSQHSFKFADHKYRVGTQINMFNKKKNTRTNTILIVYYKSLVTWTDCDGHMHVVSWPVFAYCNTVKTHAIGHHDKYLIPYSI